MRVGRLGLEVGLRIGRDSEVVGSGVCMMSVSFVCLFVVLGLNNIKGHIRTCVYVVEV